MQQRDNPVHFILIGVVVFGLTLMMMGVDAQAQITFSSDRDRNFEIYVMDTDGKKPQRLTNNLFSDRDPSWSPDSKRIIFVSERFDRDDWNREIYVMDADGDNEQKLTNAGNNWSPSWSPDGKRIAFSSDQAEDGGDLEIYVMDADGQNEKRLTKSPNADWSPSWSPDSEHIAFTSERDDENWEIYVMDADGGNQQRLTRNPHSDVDPALFGPAFAVAPAGKQFTIWGWLKQVNR